MERRVRQLNISAEERDKRSSAARRLNKKEENRLRQQYEQFHGNHEVLTVEIEQEMKKIQHELNGIREITGYEEYARASTEYSQPSNNTSKIDVNNSPSKRKRKQRVGVNPRISKINEKSRRKLTTRDAENNKVRFNSSVTADPVRSVTQQNSVYSQNISLRIRNLSTAPVKRMPQLPAQSGHRISRSGLGKKEEKLPHIMTTTVTNGQPALESVSEAREQARKRLLGEKEHSELEETTQALEDDVESYMYVPPDGRKRTVYLIPPLEDLLKEASKARYLRIPKRLINNEGKEDPERELSIDEIFNK